MLRAATRLYISLSLPAAGAWLTCAFWIAAACVPGAQADDAALRRWAEAQLARRPFYESFAPFKAVIELEYPAQMTDSEFAELAKRVEGKPEHPDRPRFEVEQRRRTQGPDRRRMTMWYGGPRQWRVNHDDLFQHDPELPPTSYDIAEDGEIHWHNVPVPGQRHIQLSRIDDPPVQPRVSVIPADRLAMQYLLDAIDGPLVDRYAIPMSLRQASATQDGVACVVAAEGGHDSIEASGRWAVPTESVLFEVLLRRSSQAPLDGLRKKVSGWADHPELGKTIASQIETSKGGRVLERASIVSVERADSKVIRQVSRIPDPSHPDVIRGAADPADPVEWIDLREADAAQSLIARDVAAAVVQAGRKERDWLSWGGLGLGALVVGLLGYRAIRAFRTA